MQKYRILELHVFSSREEPGTTVLGLDLSINHGCHLNQDPQPLNSDRLSCNSNARAAAEVHLASSLPQSLQKFGVFRSDGWSSTAAGQLEM